MKAILIFLVFLLSRMDAISHDLYVVINPLECTSCISSLKNLVNIDKAYRIILVLPQSYKKDADLIKNNFYLENYSTEYLWNDSLYNKLSINKGISTIAISSHGNFKKFLLKSFDNGKVEYINSLISYCDTIHCREDIVSVQTNFSVVGEKILFHDKLRSCVTIFDIENDTIENKLCLTDSINIKAFFSKFKNHKTYNENKQYYKALEIPMPNKIVSCHLAADTLYFISEHNYVKFEQKDTIVASFYSLTTFHKNKYVRTSIFNLSGLTKNEDVIAPITFTIFRGDVITNLLQSKQRYNKSDINPFLCSLSRTDTSTYSFKKNLPTSLPKIFSAYDYNYMQCIFWRNYACVFLKDDIYKLDDYTVIQGGLISDTSKPFNGNLFDYRRGIFDFKTDEIYGFFIYWKAEDKQCFYTKINLKTKERIVDKRISYDLNSLSCPKIDDYDYDYIFVPVNDSSLARMRMVDKNF